MYEYRQLMEISHTLDQILETIRRQTTLTEQILKLVENWRRESHSA